MSIIGYNTLNLEFREDRRIYMQSNYQSRKVPRHAVKFHQGVYGLNYETSDAIIEAAIADGFTAYNQLRSFPRGDIACSWGTLRIFRYIIEEQAFPYGYYNQDDKLLMIDHADFEHIVSYLNDLPDTFLFLQMTYNKKHALMTRRKRPLISPGSHICQGIPGSGDSGLIMSKAGAQFLIDAFTENPHGGIEVVIQNLDPNTPGTYGFADPTYAIASLDTGYWDITDWRKDQDRIRVNETQP